MMDLLVHATTSNKITPSGHIINVISRDERNVQYKPNTPIGSLDANTVYIVPKSTLELPIKRMPKLANQPFEQQTFRLQVNLPHNRRMVIRVSPRSTLAELKSKICSEKELELDNHHLVHPAQPDTVLDLSATLEVYGCAEISLMSTAGLRESIHNAAPNILVHHTGGEEEKKKKGILRIFSRKKRDSTSEASTNGLNHVVSSQSDNATLNRNSYQPKQSVKRKPAPAPPPIRNSSPPFITQSSNSINSRPESEISIKTADEVESSISHSRHSSDSSGYHEPSVFSDCSENKSPESSIIHGDHGSLSDAHKHDIFVQKDSSECERNPQLKRPSMTARDSGLKNAPSCSNVSIASTSRKRKAPQPPVNPLPIIESPSSSEAPPLDAAERSPDVHPAGDSQSATKAAASEAPAQTASQNGQQESEALQYLEDVLQESEKYTPQKIMDDSDTDSLKDEGEVISVCQAEVHANATDYDSPDSVVEPHTVVAPVPETCKSDSLAPLSNPNSQSAGYEVVDTSADDSGISQSLNSDADSSVPSLNSDYKTMSDSGCHEDIYCNVTESTDLKLVPSDTEFPAECNNGEVAETQCDSLENGAENFPDIVSDDATENPLHIEPNSPGRSSPKKTGGLDMPPKLSSDLVIKENCSDKDSRNSEKLTCDGLSSGSGSVQSSTAATPQSKKKLDNFVLSSYKRDSITDIYSLPSDHSENSCLVADSEANIEVEVPKRKPRSQPEVKIVPFKERNVDIYHSEEGECRIKEKCEQLSKTSTLPLTGRCSSMYNLTNQRRVQKSATIEKSESDLNESVNRTQSDQNILNEMQSIDIKASFLQEQKRLQEEYQKLQAQFMSWQKQLMNNQSLLQNENILPEMPLSSLPELSILENSTKVPIEDSSKMGSSNDLKMRSLPRPKTKPLTVKEPTRPKTPPILSTPTETSVVDIDIVSQEVAKRPETLASCSVNTQANVDLKDKVTQIPSPQDKVIQVPSPQEKVTSGTQVPSPENVASKEDVSAQTSIQNLASSETSIASAYSDDTDSKSQTLPRPKLKPISAFQPSETMTLNRKSRPKIQTVAVTIGSWQQRQSTIADIEPTSVASSRSKFKSLESIPQSSSKPAPVNMEKRKLPPVPDEKSHTKVLDTEKKPIPDKRKPSVDIIKESTKPNGKLYEKHSSTLSSSEETNVKIVSSAPKLHSHDSAVQKQRTDVKHVVKEQTPSFKPAKPFVKLSSMKDESHPPSIIGLKKWPLSDISESKDFTDEKQSILDDLRLSSKRPGGFVQDKIRRAEVDLRKPKSSKTDSTVPKAKEAAAASHSSNATTNAKESSAEPSKLHITKVNIISKSIEPAKAPVEKKHSSTVTTPVTAPSNANWSNTIPKSHSLNSELLAVFNKKAKDNERYKEVGAANSTTVQNITVNGSSQPPAPPPPPPPQPSSVMPTIPPAEQIPVSSRLIMARETKTLPSRKESKKSPTKISRTSDPREELMLEIRGFGGKQALRKVSPTQSGWHLKVFGTAFPANS